jgi:hypothetical protein
VTGALVEQQFNWLWGVSPLLAIAVAAAVGWIVLKEVGDAIVWLNARPCPRCGTRVQTGVVECPECGSDFGVLVSHRPEEPPDDLP